MRETHSSPVFLTGAMGGQPILVPFVELNIFEDAADGGEKPMVSTVIPIENMAFLIQSLTEGRTINAAHLAAIARSERKPASDRVDATLAYLREAQDELAKAVALFDEIRRSGSKSQVRQRLRRNF